MGPYTLGLDMGSKSIGWALISTAKKPSIIDIGVRVFPEGVDRDTKGLEKSKNAARREARGARRNRYRRKRRRDCLISTLKSAKLLPENNLELKELFNKDPYQLRAKGIDDKIGLYELGRAIFHINQRRGFKSNRKTGKQTEEGQIAKSAGELQEQIESENCRTLGEYFNKINPEEKRIRTHYTFRSMFEKELEMIWNKQAEFYPHVLTEELLRNIRDEIIFYQRPLKPTNELNNLKICNPDGSMEGLLDDQRELLLDELIGKKEVKFVAIRKKLGLLETQVFNAEYEINDKGKKNEKLKGDAFSAAMRSRDIFGPKTWDGMNDEEKRQLNEWVIELEDNELRDKLRNVCKLKEDQIQNVLKISFPRGYMSFSRKAKEIATIDGGRQKNGSGVRCGLPGPK
jgi:CRISPR-associated endonuclease Csn1